MAHPTSKALRWLQSAGAVTAGLVVIVALSIGADMIFHALGVYPAWGEAMTEPGDNLLALTYRSVFTIAGGYVSASLAPKAPVDHALALGIVDLVLSALGAVATVVVVDLGSDWYPLMLVVIALPCAWAGGALRTREITRNLKGA
ncbi:MAG: hypothetical protein ACREH4_16440 [Vitreimonas sp.]